MFFFSNVSTSLQHCCWASHQIAEHVTIVNLVALRGSWGIFLLCYLCTTRPHYNDVMMRAMASQITSRTIVYSTVYSASLAPARGIHRWQEKFPAQRASNAENASIWWRQHAKTRLFIQASGVWKQELSASDTRTTTPSKRCLLLVISLKMSSSPGIHRSPVNSPHNWPVTRKMFPFDDIIMILGIYSCGAFAFKSVIQELR